MKSLGGKPKNGPIVVALKRFVLDGEAVILGVDEETLSLGLVAVLALVARGVNLDLHHTPARERRLFAKEAPYWGGEFDCCSRAVVKRIAISSALISITSR